jgi:hypothetical protein
MQKLGVIVVVAAVIAGCGSDESPPAAGTTTPTPTPEAVADEHGHEGEAPRGEPFEKGHSRAVRKFYGGGDAPVAPEADIEAEYHQPPRPATGGIGDTITLTGTNIGVRLRTTVTGLVDPAEASRQPPAGKRYVGVALRLRSTGIAIHDSPIENALLRYPGGAARPAPGVKAACSHGFEATVRIDDQAPARGCLLFALPEDAEPREFVLALETVPAEAGGRWSLR